MAHVGTGNSFLSRSSLRFLWISLTFHSSPDLCLHTDFLHACNSISPSLHQQKTQRHPNAHPEQHLQGNLLRTDGSVHTSLCSKAGTVGTQPYRTPRGLLLQPNPKKQSMDLNLDGTALQPSGEAAFVPPPCPLGGGGISSLFPAWEKSGCKTSDNVRKHISFPELTEENVPLLRLKAPGSIRALRERQRLGAGQGMGQEHSATLQAGKQKESCRVSQDCSSVSLPRHQAGLLHSHPLPASRSLALHSREMKLQRLSLGCLAEQKNPRGKRAGKAEGVGEQRGRGEGLSMAP